MIDYTLILSRKYQGASWSLNGEDYDGLVWTGEGKPSQEELDALWPEVQHEVKIERVRMQRRAAYMAPDGPDDLMALAMEAETLGNTEEAAALRQQAVEMKAEIRAKIQKPGA